MEKYILRKAFEGWLPEEILWRQKEQFSDGVGYSWIDSIKAFAEKEISDSVMENARYRFPVKTPPIEGSLLVSHDLRGALPQPQLPSTSCRTAPQSPAPPRPPIRWDSPPGRAMADPSGRRYRECTRTRRSS